MTQDLWVKCAVYSLVVAMVASIIGGIGMTLYMNDATWLWFCLPIFMFLS